ncbi:MAG TPA: hypothetical protein ENN49_06470 [Bacteroidales bacterium]|nr:hypothetical protein [Bacteroidales bacterium]
MVRKLRPIEWIAIVVSVVLIVLIGIKVWQLTGKGNGKLEVPISNSPLDITFGSDSAQLAIYAYISYHCGYCRLFFTEVYPELEKEFIATGKVQLVLKLVEHSNNADRLNEVKTAVCINRYGYYGKLHELLVTNSSVIYTDEFRDMVNHFIDSDPLVAECILGNESLEYILQIRNEFDKFGFTGTPTFVIGNRVYKGYMPYDQFKSILLKHI